MARGKNETGVARGRLRSASREVGTSIVRPSPEITEMGVGSALRGLVKLATGGRRPKFAPKKASLEDKIKYREARAKDLKKIRDKKKAKAQAKKDKRIENWRAKQEKKRVKKKAAVKGQRPKNSRSKPSPGTKEFNDEVARRTPDVLARRGKPPVKKAAAKKPKYRDVSADRAEAKAAYDRNIRRQMDEADRRIAETRRARQPKRPTQQERIDRLREEAQEWRVSRYKYKGGSGTPKGRPR